MPKIIPVAIFDCVVFGATGDLTLRKLLPALYYRFRDGQMPAESRIIGAARSHAVRRRLPRARRHRRWRSMSPPADQDPETMQQLPRRSCTTFRSTPPPPDADWSRFDAVLDDDRVRVFYLATSPDLYGPVCRALGANGLVTEKSRVVLEKPIGHDAGLGPRDHRGRRQGLHRGADLPHRPLPGQGDGAEPDGAALRQHDLRAAVDRRRDRPRADHRGRDGRAGGPRRLLRQVRRACATWCRTTCCSCCA